MNSGDDKSFGYKWVIASYAPNSDRGKSVLAHAEIGIGYTHVNRNRAKNDNIIVAFKHPANLALRGSLVYASPQQVYSLEERNGGK